MKEENGPAKNKEFIDAYRKVRKPTAPPERVIPDKRGKAKEYDEYKEYADYEAAKDRDQDVRARVIVTGKVQGVFFRALASEQAKTAGLTGWVRNKADGSVELTLEGPKEDVQHVIDWCNTGPPAARVAGVEVFWDRPTGEFATFETRHTF